MSKEAINLAIISQGRLKTLSNEAEHAIRQKVVMFNSRNTISSEDSVDFHIWKSKLLDLFQGNLISLIGLEAILKGEYLMLNDMKHYLSNYNNLEMFEVKKAIELTRRIIIDLNEWFEKLDKDMPPIKGKTLELLQDRNCFNQFTGTQTLYTDKLNTAEVFDAIGRLLADYDALFISALPATSEKAVIVEHNSHMAKSVKNIDLVYQLIAFFTHIESGAGVGIGRFVIHIESHKFNRNLSLEIKNHYEDGQKFYRLKVVRDMYANRVRVAQCLGNFLSMIDLENITTFEADKVLPYLFVMSKALKGYSVVKSDRKKLSDLYQHLLTTCKSSNGGRYYFDKHLMRHPDWMSTLSHFQLMYGDMIVIDNEIKLTGKN